MYGLCEELDKLIQETDINSGRINLSECKSNRNATQAVWRYIIITLQRNEPVIMNGKQPVLARKEESRPESDTGKKVIQQQMHSDGL